MKAKILSTMALSVILLGVGALHAQRISVGVGIGVPGPVYGYGAMPVAPVVAPAYPAPGYGYSWVGGYWYPYGGRYTWHAGYWARPPYAHAVWAAPRYFGGHYYGGYWRR